MRSEADDAASQDTAVSARNLHKSYGEIEAVKGVDLEVAAGEAFGLIGPNGAGKSTVISLLSAMVPPSSGHASVAGFDTVRAKDLVRRHIGIVFQESTLDPHLTADQNLRFHADLYGVPRAEVARTIDRVLEQVGLTERRHSRVAEYSGGMKRRLEVGRGMLHHPKVFFIDEPTTGLDPEGRQAVWHCLRELHEVEGMTIFMTTHYLEEAEYCHRVAVMNRGSIVAVDSPDTLKASVGEDRVEISTTRPHEVEAVLRDSFGVIGAVAGGSVTCTVARGEAFLPQVLSAITAPISGVRVTRPSLDDVFRHYTRSKVRNDEDPLVSDSSSPRE